jgi:hypothetical protein
VGGLEGRVAEDEVGEEGAGQGASGAVGGAGFDVDTRDPVGLAGGQEEEVVGGVEVAAGGEDAGALAFAALGDLGLESAAGVGDLVAADDLLSDECGELVDVGGDPVDEGEEALTEDLDAGGAEELAAGGGAHDGVEDDGDEGLVEV